VSLDKKALSAFGREGREAEAHSVDAVISLHYHVVFPHKSANVQTRFRTRGILGIKGQLSGSRQQARGTLSGNSAD